MVDALKESMSEDVTLIRVLCLIYMIQLSLNELLGYIKACPLNELTDTRWNEQRSLSMCTNSGKIDIAYTLSKVIYIPQFS